MKQLAIVCLALCGLTLAQEAPRTISVTGSGMVYGEPDIAIIELGVNIAHEDISVASSEADAVIREVMRVLSDAGVEARDVRTAYYNVWRDEGYAPYGNEPPTPKYRINNVLSITVRDVAQVGALIAASLNAGANVVNSIQYTLANPEALAREARELAFNDALAKAQQLAALAGLKLGSVLYLTEGGGWGGAPYPAMRFEAGSGGVPVTGGQLAVSASVSVNFELLLDE